MISSPVSMQQISDEEKCNDDGPKWSTTTSASGPSESSTNLISKSSKSSSDTFSTKEEQENHNQIETNSTQQYVERVEVKHQKMNCKQPLPGFHQAFGSTEIGRFSRSEFFSNMVGESSNATVSNNCDRNNCDDEGLDLTTRVSTIDDIRQNGIPEVNSNNNCPNTVNNCDNSTNNFGNLTLSSYYNETRSPTATAPRWHSPCVSVIGSEI